jgi:general secretion pathway protein G
LREPGDLAARRGHRVLLAIAILLHASLACRAIDDSPQFLLDRTRSRLDVIGAALEAFKGAKGRYPTADEGLDAVERDSNDGGPFIRPGAPLRDAWHRPFVYRPRPDGSARPVILYSLGPNGRDDGGRGDDVTPAAPAATSGN